MKKPYKNIIIILSLLMVLVFLLLFLIRKPQQPVIMQTQKPVKGYISQSVTATGKIEPVDTVSVGTQISGIIKHLYVDFNSRVKKGQLLASLDKSLLQATLDQYKGNLLNAESQLSYAESNYYRQNFLLKKEVISKAEFESALNIFNTAKAVVLSAQAQVRLANKNLSYADIHSPIDGVVLNRNISTGQTVAASFNTPTLFVIAKDITKMEVLAKVDEADIGDVKVGQRASFTVDAFLDDQFEGTVKDIRLTPSISSNVVTYTTVINAPNENMKLKPGMTANITVFTKEVNEALLIPLKALSFNPDSSILKQYPVGNEITSNNNNQDKKTTTQTAFVWILKEKKLFKKEVTLGLNDNIQVEILSGLGLQDNVIIGVSSDTNPSTTKAGNQPGSPFLPKRVGGGRRGL